MTPAGLQQARDVIRQAKKVAALTGAGVSAESGIPTFRSAGGFWNGLRAEDLASPQGFARDPKLVWQWYDERRAGIAAAEPNAGHFALADFEKRLPAGAFTLITQNVDGLHERAGSQAVLRLHGSIWEVRCLTCDRVSEDIRASLPDLPPECEVCGGMLRPGVVWFGENLPPGVFEAAMDAVSAADVLIVAGTSAVVYPAASLAPLARAKGATVIEINPEATPVTEEAHIAFQSTSATLLPQLLSV